MKIYALGLIFFAWGTALFLAYQISTYFQLWYYGPGVKMGYGAEANVLRVFLLAFVLLGASGTAATILWLMSTRRSPSR